MVSSLSLSTFAAILTRGRRGSTREIVGEKGKRVVIHDDGKFDPASIPLKSWADFENELWEQVRSCPHRECSRPSPHAFLAGLKPKHRLAHRRFKTRRHGLSLRPRFDVPTPTLRRLRFPPPQHGVRPAVPIRTAIAVRPTTAVRSIAVRESERLWAATQSRRVWIPVLLGQ